MRNPIIEFVTASMPIAPSYHIHSVFPIRTLQGEDLSNPFSKSTLKTITLQLLEIFLAYTIPTSMARILLLFGIFFVCHFIRAEIQPSFVFSDCFEINENKTSLEERNRILYQLFINNVTSQASIVKFYNVTAGEISNKMYVLFQCRDDLTLDTCWTCVNLATQLLLPACRSYLNFDEAVVWYEECMLRFSTRNFFSLYDPTPSPFSVFSQYSRNISNVADLTSILAKTMDGVIKAAAMGSNGSHFASAETNLTSSEKLYCFAQCTSDLDDVQCQSCLKSAFAAIDFTIRDTGVMSFQPSCQLRYNNKSFLVGHESLAPPSSPLSPGHQGPVSNKKRPLKPAVVIEIASAASLGLVLVVAAFWLCLRRKKSTESLEHLAEGRDGTRHALDKEDISNLESLQFNFADVKAATCNFYEENKLGQGGFGEVYKGKLSNGKEIAVKRLSRNSQQGAFEFENEVLLLVKLQHRNLVKLLGFCISRGEKILIYEFLSNSSLDRSLFDPLKRASLKWGQRFKIITGVARGLLYLHEDSRLKIIHRDLKASNILLDETMNAKIADFGLARIFDLDQTQGDTMRIAGTFGYMAPEYVLAGHFSAKSDVYSFGVIVLEIVSGQKNNFYQSDEGLLHRAWRLWNEDAILELVDPLLSNTFSEEEVKLCIQIGLLCIQEDAAHRPRMASVVAALNGQSITLPSPNSPHIFTVSIVVDANYDSLLAQEFQQLKSDPSHGTYTGTTNITELSPR